MSIQFPYQYIGNSVFIANCKMLLKLVCPLPPIKELLWLRAKMDEEDKIKLKQLIRLASPQSFRGFSSSDHCVQVDQPRKWNIKPESSYLL